MSRRTLGVMRKLECVDLVEQVTSYQEGSLDVATQSELTRHIGVCWACEYYLGQLGFTVQLLAQLPPEQQSEQLWSNLIGAYRTWALEVRT